MADAALMESLIELKALIESALLERLPSADSEPRDIHAAMHYAVMSGGKRLRPTLALAVAELGNAGPHQVLDAACAIEFVHTASLILDDLPAMDNADFRRSQPSVHVVYGEATAILAALALLAEAYALTARNAKELMSAEGVADVIETLSRTIGTAGLIRGQHVDLTSTASEVSPEILDETYRQKAAVLFQAAIAIPAKLIGMDEQQQAALEVYATQIGVAFQITDDIIDGEHGTAEDAHKCTFNTILGEAGARRKASELVFNATGALQIFGDRGTQLRMIAEYVATRAQ
ncbi:MAG: polyprenyl synthetase family protein [Candidatus Hydrogenedentes bacterium]|nr:polyprenyl synthetase family protein [Candidatus Hydrogenedentota bacterium]